MQTVERDGLTIRVYRYGFQSGFYAEAVDAQGKRLAFTGVHRGPGSKEKAIQSALHQARTGEYAPDDRGCPG